VAHDFNNLLQIIQSNLQMIETDTRDRPRAAARLKNALRGVERAASLTRSLLAFARRQPLAPKVVNLGRLIAEMDEMLTGALGEEIEVTTQVQVGLWNTLADTAQFETAILNLAINARDAMNHKGRLTIALSNESVETAFDDDDSDAVAGDYVSVVICDTGEGMTAEVRERAFDPFFTTKDQDRGTGLGLSMVYGFVKQSKGHVEIESEPGAGATIKIYLPRCDEAELVEAPPAEPAPGAAGTILVVDDDELVRDAAVGMLAELGYDCVTAASGAEALAILESGRRIDLLFTDVVMPGPVSAKALAERGRAIVAGLPVLFASGYSSDAITSHGRLDEGVDLISKPYEKGDLAKRIGRALAASRPQVLVVEDEGLVRMSAVDMISALGFAVLEAGDADEALKILDAGERVDVLFTDVGLPGMRGPELAAQAQKARPGLKVVFASGYGEGERGPPAGSTHLSKPYDQDDLAKVLRG
jgi:CheY-like chemotaxis protein